MNRNARLLRISIYSSLLGGGMPYLSRCHMLFLYRVALFQQITNVTWGWTVDITVINMVFMTTTRCYSCFCVTIVFALLLNCRRWRERSVFSGKPISNFLNIQIWSETLWFQCNIFWCQERSARNRVGYRDVSVNPRLVIMVNTLRSAAPSGVGCRLTAWLAKTKQLRSGEGGLVLCDWAMESTT